jgi:hypothetical protein
MKWYQRGSNTAVRPARLYRPARGWQGVAAVFDRFGRSVRDLIESLKLFSSWASSSSQRSHKGKRLGRPRIGIGPPPIGSVIGRGLSVRD